MNEPKKVIKKSELIQHICEEVELPKGKVKAVVEQVFDAMSEGVLSGETFKIKGIGKFVVKDRPESTETNQETGETVNVPSKKVMFFRPDESLQKQMTTP